MSRIPSLLLLVTHLTAMQVAGAGPLIATLLDACGVRHPLLRSLTRVSWWSFWIGAILGGAAIVTQITLVDRDYGPAVEMFSYKLIWGLLELVVFVVALWAYLWGWRGMRDSAIKRGTHMALGLFAATNLLYHFPPLMLLFSRVVVGRIEPMATLPAAAYRSIAFRSDLLAATLHFWLASLVTASAALMMLAVRYVPRQDDKTTAEGPVVAIQGTDPSISWDGDAGRVGRWGAAIALAAAMLQLPVGMWMLAALPHADQSRMLGGDLWVTAMLAIGFFAALALMQELAGIAFGGWTKAAVHRSVVKLTVIMVTMVAASLQLGT